MPHSHPRHVRIAQTVQRIIAPELLKLQEGALVTVTHVEVSKDLHAALVHYAVIGAETDAIQEVLDGMVGDLRHKLAKGMETKSVPTVSFIAAPRTVDGQP